MSNISEDKYGHSGGDTGVVSMEETFVRHFMNALDRLQSTWMEDEFDPKKFNMQLLYLIRILPDTQKQKEIFAEWADAKTEMDQGSLKFTETERQAYAGMEVVTELILFICQTFELINTDITGPATLKDFQNAVLELPDMPSAYTGIPDENAEASGVSDE